VNPSIGLTRSWLSVAAANPLGNMFVIDVMFV